MSDAILELEHVTVRGPRGARVEDASLAVERGSVHAIVGPNGAGKSTLVAAVLGAIEHAGTVRFAWKKGGRVGYVPQNFDVDRTLPITVAEFLALSRSRRPVCLGVGAAMRAEAARLLAPVGLGDFGPRAMATLSGGELQRVLLANAVDPAPELLVLDEPAAGLDESAERRFEETLLALARGAGATVLMVSHDLAQVRRIADRVTLLHRTVRRTGTPAEVLAGDLGASLAAASGGAA
ncbi:MAG TPA: metal ABC transporter ATP-binding protein [bacterium]|nr:metal ABC transporter ATP-binding protein [bacterium]